MTTALAAIKLIDHGRPGRGGGDGPRLGLGADLARGTSPYEKERIAREIGRAELLLSRATPAQARLLQRLAAGAPMLGLRFAFAATLEAFLRSTASYDDQAAAAISDGDLAKKWRELADAKPDDHAIEIDGEIDYGGGKVRIGIRDGVPFEEPVKAKQGRATSYEGCLEIAKQKGRGYGIRAGWLLCLQQRVPEPPDSVEIDGKEYVNCIGFGLAEKTGMPVFGFDEGDGIEEFPVEKVLGKRLSKAARLWLDSYETWRATQKRPSRKR